MANSEGLIRYRKKLPSRKRSRSVSSICFTVHAGTYDISGEMAYRGPVVQSERVRLAWRLAPCGVARCGPPVGPDEEVGTLEFVRARNSFRVEFPRHLLERQRRQIRSDERNLRRKPGYPLVRVVEGLQIGKLHHCKNRLLERIFNLRDLGQKHSSMSRGTANG